MRSIRSMHWKNIAPSIVAQQRRVVEALGYSLIQEEQDWVEHGYWLTKTLEEAPEDEVILFLDIDAFPLTRAAVERAFAAAEAGAVHGVAQTANHMPQRDFIYAAPSFLCVSKATWRKLGSPDMEKDREHDVGMKLSLAAAAAGTPLELLMPSFVATPKWRLGTRGCVGIGTVYAESAFHLFEARIERGYRYALDHIADAVCEGRDIDYVQLHQVMNSARMARRRWWAEKGERWKRFVDKHILRKKMHKKVRPAWA